MAVNLDPRYRVDPVQESTDHQDAIFSTDIIDQSQQLQESSRYLGYRKLVSDISDQLLKENALRLAYLYSLPAWYYEVGPTHDTAFALRVLIALEGKGVYSPDNLEGLKNALKSIDKEDAARIVDDYIRSTAKTVWEKGRLNSYPEEVLRQTVTTRSFRGRQILRSNGLHCSSMIALVPSDADDIERDLVEEPLNRSRSRPDLIAPKLTKSDGVSSDNHELIESSMAQEPSLQRSHQDFRLALGCVIASAEVLVRQLSDVSHHTSHSSILTGGTDNQHYPLSSSPKDTAIPGYLTEAIVSAKQVVRNLKHAYSSSRLPKHPSSLSEPVTPARSSPVRDLDPFFSDSRKFSRSSSNGRTRVSKHSSVSSGLAVVASSLDTDQLEAAKRQLSFVQDTSQTVEPNGGLDEPSPKPTAGSKSILTAPQSEKMHGNSPTQVPNSSSRIRRSRSKREVKQFSRKGLLFWQIKVKKLRTWITQNSSQIESEDFYDHHKRRFKAVLHPNGLGADEGRFMTLAVDCLDEPRSKEVLVSKIVVNFLDPQSSNRNIPTNKQSLERRGIRFFQQFVSHEQVAQFSNTGVVVITIAIVSENTDESDRDST